MSAPSRRAAREAARRRRHLPTWAHTRDGILFIVGIGGIVNEALLEAAERPTLLLLYAAMVGLPAFIRSDEKHKPEPPHPPKEPSA